MDEPIAKRQRLESEAQQVASIGLKSDVADVSLMAFQNSQLVQCLREQRHNISDLEDKVSELAKVNLESQNALLATKRHWCQLDEDVKLLLSSLPGGTIANGLGDESCVDTSADIVEPLTLSWCKGEVAAKEDSDESAVDSLLSLPSKDVFGSFGVAVSSRLLKNIAEAVNHCWEKYTQGRPETKIENGIDGNDLNNVRSSLEEMHRQYRAKTALVQALRERAETSESKVAALDSEVGALREDMMVRMRTIARLKREVEEFKRSGVTVLETSATNSSSPTAGDQGPRTDTNPDVSHLKSSREQDLLAQVDDLTSKVVFLESENDRLNSEKLDAIKESQRVRIESSSVSDDVIRSSQLYTMLYQQYQFAIMDVHASRPVVDSLQRKAREKDTIHHDELEKLKANAGEQLSLLDRRLRQFEEEAASKGAECSALRFKLDHLNATLPSRERVAEMTNLLTSFQKENSKMRSENTLTAQIMKEIRTLARQRNYDDIISILKVRSTNSNESVSSIDDVSSRNNINNINSSNDDVRRLSTRIAELEGKELIWKEEEQSLHMMIDVFKSANKDKRELNEVRLAEKKLREELQLVTERLLVSETALNAASVVNTDCLRSEVVALQSALQHEKNLVAVKDEEIESLISEVESIGQDYESVQAQNVRLLSQISSKEDMNSRLVAQSIKTANITQLLKDEADSQTRRVLALEELNKDFEHVNQSLEARLKAAIEVSLRATEESRLAMSLLDSHKRVARELSTSQVDIIARLTAAEEATLEARSLLEVVTANCERESTRARRLDEEISRLKCRVTKPGSNVGDRGNDDELQDYKRALRCQVCNDRQKNSVITRCMHVFCSECLEENLRSRHRKCPSCGGAFGKDDVQEIFL